MSLLHELETIPQDNFKPKITSLSRGIFKQSSKSARKSAGGTDYSITLQETGDADILVEVYQKMIAFILGGSPGGGGGSGGGSGGISSSGGNGNNGGGSNGGGI
ncbi:hypothetical protein PCASD_07966 [Puccinia coronata f. sp. avenae]|uniref:Uncharacterized protein n=1 Tax=Puccinia coronata f. sp. avenae TaxID=200324 RepID=A0A2N5UTG0_9BASI|nr:hypothetical protein PCASD_07966 [Puccinia coronata f. sp. avenae]